MSKFSPEIEAIITTIIYMDCRMEAILRLLEEKGISLDSKTVESRARRIHSIQGSVLRYQFNCRLRDPSFDIK